MECSHVNIKYHNILYAYICMDCKLVVPNRVKYTYKTTSESYVPSNMKTVCFEKHGSSKHKAYVTVDSSVYEKSVCDVMQTELFLPYVHHTDMIIKFISTELTNRRVFVNRLSRIDFYYAVCLLYLTDKLEIPILMRDVIRSLVRRYKTGSLIPRTKTYILSHFNSSVKLLFNSKVFSRSNYLIVVSRYICDKFLNLKDFANVEYFINQIYLKLIDIMITSRTTDKTHKKKQFISLSEYYIYLPVYIYIRYESITKRRVYTKHGVKPMSIDHYMSSFCNTNDRNTFNRHYSILKTYDKSLCP
jgi:hypothetical protein